MVVRFPQQFLAEEQIGDVTVVTFNLAEIVDERVIRRISRQLLNLVEHSQSHRLVLNLGSVGKLSATVVGTFIALNRLLGSQGGKLVLCGVEDGLRNIFYLFKVPQFMRICKDEQEALQAF
jgi:anti-anti-sigma regulatory factor